MSQRNARPLNPEEERFESGNFSIYELNLTGDEEEHCHDGTHAKILETFRLFPDINRHSKGKYKVTVPNDIPYFIGRTGSRARDLAWSIQRRHGHFVAWRQVQHTELATLHWLTEIQERPAIRIMAQIEFKYLLLFVEDMVDKGIIWYDDSAKVWAIERELIDALPKRKTWEAPNKSRPNHGRPRGKSRNVPPGTSTGQTKRSRPIGRKSW